MPSALSAHPVRPCLRCKARCATAGSARADESLLAPNEEDVTEDQEVTIHDDQEEIEVEKLKHIPDPGRPTSRQPSACSRPLEWS